MATVDRTIAPPVTEFGHIEIPEVRIETLDNGIPLTILDNGEQEVNRLTLLWNGGIAETRRHSIATIATNMLREGTHRHSGAEIAETFDYNGSWLKSSMQSHHTSLVLHSLNSRTADVLPMLAETITEPSFPEKEFAVLREKTARSIELEREKVEYYSQQQIRRMVMGESHPLAQNDMPDDVRALTTEDIAAFHSRTFSPSTCRIFLAGRITPEIEDMVNNTFGTVKPDTVGQRLNVVPFTPSATSKLSITRRKGALQSSVRMAIPTINRQHPDYIPLRLAVTALGGYFGSRLMMNIREDKGYTYGISSSLLGYREGGMAAISTQCDNRYVEPLIKETRHEIERLANEAFPDDELCRLKHYAMTQLVSMLDSPFTIMDYYEIMYSTPTPNDYFARQIDAIKALTGKEIARLVSEHLPLDCLYTALTGDI